MVLGPSDSWDGEDVVWRLVWAAWRRIWKEDEITSVDALQASSWAKSTMGTYCTHFRKMALWVGYTPASDLEQAACRYIFQLWGLGYSGSSLKVAVSAFRALEDMGWLPAFVSRRVWRCAKWAPTEPALRPYAGLDDLRNFALACTERPQWTVYGMAVLAFTCLLRVGEAAPLRRGGLPVSGLGVPHGQGGTTHRAQATREVCPSMAGLARCQGGHVRCRWSAVLSAGPSIHTIGHGCRVGGQRQPPRQVARMEAGGLRGPAMVGATHQVAGLVGAVAVGDGGSPLRRRTRRLRRHVRGCPPLAL